MSPLYALEDNDKNSMFKDITQNQKAKKPTPCSPDPTAKNPNQTKSNNPIRHKYVSNATW